MGQIFSQWMKARNHPSDTSYVNWIGRTVVQVREECALRESLMTCIRVNRSAMASMQNTEVLNVLQKFAASEVQAGRLTLAPPEPTPLIWSIKNILHLVGVPLALLVLAPSLLIYAPFFIWILRRRESADPEMIPRIDLEHANALAAIEDRDTTNQFSAFGSIKPGPFRRWLLVFVLWIIQYTTQHIYNRGRLARVSTIHFARWVWVDGHKRLFFASNYDGSLEAYMDDFINKVSFGLNAVFSNGIGYPTSRWLIAQGAKDEQKFKYYIRRHQLPTEVWYNAHPGLSAYAMQRNEAIRQGLEKAEMTGAELQQWLQLF